MKRVKKMTMKRSKTDIKFRSFLLKRRKRVNDLLSYHLKKATQDSPKGLRDAMKYVVLNGGKKLRPLLVYAVGEAYKADLKVLDAAAVAIEMIHSFSLVHDDLPAMDNDSLRRGRPTCHLAFDEATAILVGDALSILAFQILSENRALSFEKRVKMIEILAEASGPRGMAGGQYVDLHMFNKPTKSGLEKMYRLKTASLISAAIKMGASAANVNRKHFKQLERFALNIGLAFQIRDDILNVEGSVDRLGKNTGTDKTQNKTTYPMLVGIPKAKLKMEKLCQEANRILKELKIESSFLGVLTDFIIQRDF